MQNVSETKGDIFQIMRNGKSIRSFDSIISAVDFMVWFIQEEVKHDGVNGNQYELSHQQDNHIDHLIRFPTEIENVKKKDIHPFLQNVLEKGIFDNEGYIHEITHNLLVLDELRNKKYTIIGGNDSFLDLIKYVDITEYSLAYCPKCKSVQHCKIEGCDGLISFTCDNCNEVIFDAFRNK
ncbi:MAG: hypothetical protein KAU62_18145 [Candidatus Heimdallarchaeota archaeon]|nr:hypothetical protein [Candidatus Heimdallarchaeota archaeon]MCK4613084.1 hypothetical protein [Candidatus Heimdallarchaeota archaeon]